MPLSIQNKDSHTRPYFFSSVPSQSTSGRPFEARKAFALLKGFCEGRGGAKGGG